VRRSAKPPSDHLKTVAAASPDATWLFCMYRTYVPNKTISVPDDVVPIIDSLDIPFSRWVTDQLRRHAARTRLSFAQQLETDAALAGADRRPTRQDARAAGERMERSAPW
jgi:hypothetical protein